MENPDLLDPNESEKGVLDNISDQLGDSNHWEGEGGGENIPQTENVPQTDGQNLYSKVQDTRDNIQNAKDKYNNLKNNVDGLRGKATNNSAKELGKGLTNPNALAKGAGKAGEKALEKGAQAAGKAIAKEGAKAGAKLAAEGALTSTGVGAVAAAGIEALDRINQLAKKLGIDVGEKLKEARGNLSKAGIGLIIALTVVINSCISMPALGAINGSEGKSELVGTAANNASVKNILSAASQVANVTPAIKSGGGPSSGENPGTLKGGGIQNITPGESILNYKRLRFSSRDKTFLQNIYDKGFDSEKNMKNFDQRIAQTLIYLANRHSSIYVSNIVSGYEDMPIDTENSSKPQVAANISAHKTGQAADIRQIDFVYTGLDIQTWANGQCGPPEVSDKVDIVWLNDQKKELLRKKCKGSMLTLPLYTGGPIFASSTKPSPGSQSTSGVITTKAIPIQVAWQDDPPKLSGNSQGTTRGYAERNMEQSLKLPAGSLDKSAGNDVLQQTGFSEIAQQIGMNSQYVTGSTADQLWENVGKGYLEQIKALPSGSLDGNTIQEIAKNTGERTLDDIFQLPVGSWQGNDLEEIANSTGKRMMEKEFGFSSGALDNLDVARQELQQLNITQEDIEEVATNLNLDKDQLKALFDSIKNNALNNDILNTFGTKRLERAWNLQDGQLDSYVNYAKNTKNQQTSGTGTASNPVGDLATIVTIDDTNNTTTGGIKLSNDQLKAILTSAGNATDITQPISNLGGGILDNAFGLTDNTTSLYLQNGSGDPFGQLDDINNTIDNEAVKEMFSNNFQKYKNTLGKEMLEKGLTDLPQALSVALDEGDKNLLMTNPKAAAENIGMKVLQKNTGCTTCTFKDVTSQPKVLNQIEDAVGLKTGTLQNVFSGQSAAGGITSFGSSLGGIGTGITGGGDDKEIMNKVYRPEARRKVHQVLNELLDMPGLFNNPKMKITQLITYNQERDVDPFESKLEPLYGKAKKNGGSRADNYGLFSMPESHPNIHIGF